MTRTDPLSRAALLAIAGAVALAAVERAGHAPSLPALPHAGEPAPYAAAAPGFWGFP